MQEQGGQAGHPLPGAVPPLVIPSQTQPSWGCPELAVTHPPQLLAGGFTAAARRKSIDPWPEMKPLFIQISQISVLGITLMLFSSDKCLIYFPS